MTLAAGTRLGVYEITALIGEGGMGQVHRATDTTLGRQVAIKILPDALASHPERLARFEREAKTLASLNHPNIAAIYGFEKSGGMHALVMELVEGDDLSQRIARGAIPLDEALPIAKQIAEALEAAHEQGIIHRDLKPANIKVRSDGTVKVLDFGLAKAMEPPAGSAEASPYGLSQSPTITSPAMMTGVGMILGTAAYMSPEQAKGKTVDKRADIWAFGCVLFEMLTATRAFGGDDVQDTFVAIMRDEPDWSALPPAVPPAIRALLKRCLEKKCRARVADISTALFVLAEHASLATTTGPHDPAYVLQATASAQTTAAVTDAVSAAGAALAQSMRRRVLALTVGALVLAIIVGAGVWFAMRPGAPVPPRVTRTTVSATGPAALTINGVDRDLAITPDGSRVIYVGNRGTQLFVRALDALAPVAVFTGQPRGPFVSPDGQWIGFMDGTTTLKKVAVTGGPAVTLATLDGNGPRGATWALDDTIVFATNAGATGLQRVGAAGGPVTVLTRPDRARGETYHLWPERLPGGRAVLFTITATMGGLDAAQVAVLDLQTGTRTILVRGGSHAHYVPAGRASQAGFAGGYLVYAAAGTLRAVPFDLATLTTRGTPVPVVPDVVTTGAGGVDAVVAGDGTLAYVSGAAGAVAARTLVWVDRQGRETPIPAPPRAYTHPRVSPDGTRIAVSSNDQEQDIWLWDLARTTLTRVTFDPAYDSFPVWTPDGRRLLFSSERAGARNLFWQAADGTGAVERLTESPNLQSATAVSPAGRRLIFTEQTPKTGDDVMQVEVDGTHPTGPGRVTPLVQSPFSERNGIVSPDGRWLAYEANDSGRYEIAVRPYPDVTSGHWQVSTGGGTRPLWAPNGQELFFVSPTGALMRVGVERASSWAATTPTLLVKDGYVTSPGGNFGRSYDFSSDGERFLLIKEGGGTDELLRPHTIIVILNWTEELKRLVPVK